jgi:hypothetical protein
VAVSRNRYGVEKTNKKKTFYLHPPEKFVSILGEHYIMVILTLQNDQYLHTTFEYLTP